MRNLNFLVIGKNEFILPVLVRLINKEEKWKADGFIDEKMAFEMPNFMKYDILMLSSGIDESCENEIRTKALALNPTIKIIQHYGGGSGLLKTEILSVLNE